MSARLQTASAGNKPADEFSFVSTALALNSPDIRCPSTINVLVLPYTPAISVQIEIIHIDATPRELPVRTFILLLRISQKRGYGDSEHN